MKKQRWKSADPYHLFLLTLFVLTVAAFAADSPADILRGLKAIFTSPGRLTTDYIAVGGLGAALISAVMTGIFSLGITKYAKIKPNGATIMAIWLAIGFSFFGKNVLSMLPIVGGAWLYAKYQKEPFTNYSLVALLSTTLTPVVSELSSAVGGSPLVSLFLAVFFGLVLGFLMPVISAATNRVHGGYDLYNVGFAGGILAFFIVAIRSNFGVHITERNVVSGGNNLFLAVLLYLLCMLWCSFSLLSDKAPREILQIQKKIYSHSGRLVSDYYLLYGHSAYFNMGILGILGTSVTLLLGAQLNGITLAAIFTMMGFGAFGKHLKNCIPPIAGAILFALVGPYPLSSNNSIIAILFCTGLAPIAGQYGWAWGVVSGMLHIAIVGHTALFTGGLNLYNNGFAAGFVALVLVPVILAFRRGRVTT